MFTYEIDHVIAEKEEMPVAYIRIKNAATGGIVKTVCVNYVDKDTLINDMQGHVDTLKASQEMKILIETEIRTILTTDAVKISAGKGAI